MAEVKLQHKPQQATPSPAPKATVPVRAAETDLDMDKAPKDGKPVFLTEDGETYVAAVWRTTRKWNSKRMAWEPNEFWALHNGGSTPVPFKPLGWKPWA